MGGFGGGGEKLKTKKKLIFFTESWQGIHHLRTRIPLKRKGSKEENDLVLHPVSHDSYIRVNLERKEKNQLLHNSNLKKSTLLCHTSQIFWHIHIINTSCVGCKN